MPRLAQPGEVMSPSPEVAHHLIDVVRVRIGESIIAFDGQGFEARAKLIAVVEGVPHLLVEEPPRSARPVYPLWLLLAVTKGPAMDAAIRAATECGVTDIQPILTQRSVPKGDRADRWERIVESAAQQCGRADVPVVHPVARLDLALQGLPPGSDLRVAYPGAQPLSPASGTAAVVIGPEGGLTELEIAQCLTAGGRALGLGRWVLRVETAVPVALAFTTGG